MARLALKVEHTVDHMFEHFWTSESSIFGHMPNEESGNAVGFRHLDNEQSPRAPD